MQKSLYFETIYKLFVVMIDRCSSQFKTGQRCHCLFPSFKSRLTKKKFHRWVISLWIGHYTPQIKHESETHWPNGDFSHNMQSHRLQLQCFENNPLLSTPSLQRPLNLDNNFDYKETSPCVTNCWTMGPLSLYPCPGWPKNLRKICFG